MNAVYANQVGTAPRELSTLEMAVSSISTGHDELRRAIEVLDKKLGPVLQPERPVPAPTDTAARPGLSAVETHSVIVTALHNERGVIEGLLNYVNGLTARLES